MLCRGERIAYELALQELQVVYNGFGGAPFLKPLAVPDNSVCGC